MIYVAFAFLGLSALLAFANIAGIIGAVAKQRRGIDEGYSSVPLFSLLFSLVAWALAKDTIGLWAFVAAAIDPGTWMLLGLPRVFFGRGGFLRPDAATKASRERSQSPVPADTPSVHEALTRARRLLIDELERSAEHHEARRYGKLGSSFLEIDALVNRVLPQPNSKQSVEYEAYCFLDSWIDSSNHGWSHYEPVKQSDWPRLARRMVEVLRGRREFSREDFEGVLS